MSETLNSPVAEKITFGPFVFDRASRELTQNGAVVRLRKREGDLLNILVERPGDYISEAELMTRASAKQSVSEITLRVQMASLQRILEDEGDSGVIPKGKKSHFIQFMPGAGYRFDDLSETLGSPALDLRKRHNLPCRRKVLFGRDAFLVRLQGQFKNDRLITIVADGGTGKTAVAMVAAEQALETNFDGVWLVDLAGIGDGPAVAEAIASTLDLPVLAASQKSELIKWLSDHRILLILDNCEHLIEPVGELVAEILTQTPHVKVLATSRVPLGSFHEAVISLPTLAVPPAIAMTADIALTFPAVAFFVESVRSHGRTFDLDVFSVRTAIDLCRGLNGNPLAIELAAAQLCLIGTDSLADRPEALAKVALDIASMWKRQDSVLAMLDWSYQGLSAKAQILLTRLSVCRREFTQETALAIATDAVLSSDDVLTGLAELTNKSLITVAEFADPVIYHMLVLVRDYGTKQLQQQDDFNKVYRRHALNCLEQLKNCGSDAPDQSNAASIEDIRAGVDWSFSEDGDALTGMRLISLAVDNKKKLYGIQDYARQLDRALARYDELRVIEPRLQLRIIVERMCINQHGTNDRPLMARLKSRAFELAQGIYSETGDPADLFAIHQTAFSLAFGAGDGPEKKLYARQMTELAVQSGHAAIIEIMSARMSAQAHHFMGEHNLAVPIMRKVMAMPDSKIRKRVYIPGDRVDPRITLGIFNARSSWLLGSPDRATEEANALVEKVRANWDYVLCYVIGFSALPIAIWRGDVPGARVHLAEMHTRATDFNLDYWADWADCYSRALEFFESGHLTLTDPSLAKAPNNMQADLMATFHEGLLTQEAVERVEAGFVGWCAPEVLRNDADRQLRTGTLTAAEAEAQLTRALNLAERQEALAWQLRLATSLGRLWRYQGKSAQARILLERTTDGFTQGFDDTDFVNAISLLKDI
jgi:predicted ATPase/DNA-binding winged helix-turn-helix (wHTH) protein